MPSPPFQPLTLSVEQWRYFSSHSPLFGFAQLVAECEAQAQAAADLRQQLDEERAEFAVKMDQARMEPSGGYLHANAQAEVYVLKAQLADAQQRLEEARATNTRLNRVLTNVAPAVEDNLEACRKAGMSFGRRLSGAGYMLEREKRIEAEARASQAEAALKDMHKLVDDFESWLKACINRPQRKPTGVYGGVLAELQRRRSPRGQEAQDG